MSIALRHVILDVETTGLSCRRGDRVIEIGAVAVESGRITAEFHALIDPGRRISPFARQVHGISEAMLAGKPPPETVFPAFHSFLADSPLVGHNIGFDLGFLRAEFARLGLGLPQRSHCTLQHSRRRYPHLPNHRLETVARHVLGEIPPEVRLHRALADARLTARVWLAMGMGEHAVGRTHGSGGHMGPPLRNDEI